MFSWVGCCWFFGGGGFFVVVAVRRTLTEAEHTSGNGEYNQNRGFGAQLSAPV